MFRRILTALFAAAASPALAADPAPLWDLDALRKPPTVTWADETGTLRKLYYANEPVAGKPTRVFAYYAEPAKYEGKLPAMVLVHGGGGKAFAEWAELWAKRGYAALAMDLSGRGPDGKRLADAGPDQGDADKLPLEPRPLKDLWTYHAIAAVVRANSLLRSLPQVDPDRVGVTGISWGGYLTCIAAGVDDRFKCAVPVYGCGFLHEDSVWTPTFAAMPEKWRAEWVANFDPSSHVGKAKMPVLFVNGTNDFAYPLGSYRKTYRLVKDRTLAVTVGLPHSHPAGWAPPEIGAFADQHLKAGPPLALERWKSPVFEPQDGRVTVPVPQTGDGKSRKVSVRLHWTTDLKQPWQKRTWQTLDKPEVNVGNATDFYGFTLPKNRPLVYFVTLTDERGLTVSSEHVEVE